MATEVGGRPLRRDRDPHRRTDHRFEELVGRAGVASDPSELAIALLHGMHEIATLLVELEIGQQMLLNQGRGGDDAE